MILRHYITAISLTVMSVASAAEADSVRIVTLDQCREMAVGSNAKVQIADRQAQSAEQLKKEAFTKYFPTVKAQGLWFQGNKGLFQYDVLDLFTIELIKKGATASVTAVQPLFAGGRIVNGNKLAGVGAEAARLQHEGSVTDARLTAETYYWNIVTLKAQRSTLESVIVMTDSLRAHVAAAVKAGVVTSNELLKVELALNDLKATRVDLDNGIVLSRKLLAQYIGLGDEPIDIPEADVPEDVPPFPSDIFMSADQALPSTTDYRLLQAQVKAAELKQRIAVGNNLPTVGVGAGLFHDDLLNQRHHFGAIFVSVTVPISDWWGGSHAIKRSKIDTANARTEMTDLSQMLKIGMDDQWDNLTAAHRKMQIAHESIIAAKENLRISRNQYLAGVCTITDLLDAQALYRAGNDQYITAYGNFCTARARYLKSTGRL